MNLKCAVFVGTLVIVVVSLSSMAEASLGADLSTLINVSQLACLKKSGRNFVIVRSYRSIADIDHNAVQTLKNANSAGLRTHVYHFPCITPNNMSFATAQVAANVANLAANKAPFDYFFFDIEPFQGNCAWPDNQTLGCEFLETMIISAKQLGLQRLGIYASIRGWNLTVGMECNVGAKHGLVNWYAEWPRPEHPPNFATWVPFGGWITPFMHQYDDTVADCGLGGAADADWTPYW